MPKRYICNTSWRQDVVGTREVAVGGRTMLDLPDGHAEMFHGRASGAGWLITCKPSLA